MSLLDTSTQIPLDLYEHAPFGFHCLDSHGIFLRINDTELRWLGYRREEMIGCMNLADILTIEGKDTFAENFPQLKATGVLRDLEFDFVRKDQTLLPVLVSATAVWNASGEFTMIRSVACNLSGQKQAENRFRSILEAASDAILICNRWGLITVAGGQTEKLFGYRNGELKGQSIEMLLPERSRKVHSAYVEGFFSKPQVRPMGIGRQLSALRKDGTELPVEISLSPLQADEGLCTLAIVHDVTTQRLTQDELRKSEERYRSVISAMAEGVVVQNSNGTISACNQSAERILGLTESQMMGRTSIDPHWKAIHEDGSPFPGETHPSMVALRTGQRQSNVCMGLRKPNSITTWILINAEPIFHPGTEHPRAVVTTFSDITDRKLLEAQLSQAQKLEAIGRLAGGVAHDFNNILGVILGHCDLMAEQLAGVDRAVPHTTAIRKSAQHAAALTRQLLAFSRKQVMQMQELNLNEVVGALTEMLKRLIGENIELTLDLAPELGMVNADPVQIEQVVMNLVVNARDAMPKGGRITIGTANVELDRAYVSSRPPVLPGSYVMISVSDTGHGMDEATVAHLFEPFFTTKELGRGTGLGLSIIYGIVRQSNGHVLVYTEPGLGSTFKVYLPRLEGRARDKVQSIPSFNALDQRSETILLVEDDQDLREMIASMLAASGYTVLSASTAKEALTVSESHPGLIALMLTDVVLRGSADGQELSRQIKVQRPNIRILFMSGYSESFVASSSDSANPAELLQKPFSSEELRRRIFRVLATPS